MAVTAAILGDDALDGVADLLARKVGLRLDLSIRGRLSRCVLDDAAAHRLEVSTYIKGLETEPALMQTLLDRVTVQETSFFRDPNQFAALRNTVLADVSGPLSIWSAGCANGQEAYSLAMTLADMERVDWRIAATDISSRALERTRRATYTTRELAQVSTDDRLRHFAPEGPDWRVAGSLRARVDVMHQNLVADPPPFEQGECDIVFCRNVLIYFRDEDVLALVDRLARWLRPGAWLFLGYSESLWQLTDAFQLVRLGDAFAYRRRGSGPQHAHARQGASPVVALPHRPRIATPSRRRATPATAAKRSSRVPPKTVVAEIGLGSPSGSSVAPSGMSALTAAGEAALSTGDTVGAVAAFRKCAFLEPDQPMAHLHLGLALEASGDPVSARRAFGAARRVLHRSGTAAVEAALQGYELTELGRLLDAKLQAAS